MKRQYLTGAEKRKIKRQREQENKSLSNTILKFVSRPSSSNDNGGCSTSFTPESTGSANDETQIPQSQDSEITSCSNLTYTENNKPMEFSQQNERVEPEDECSQKDKNTDELSGDSNSAICILDCDSGNWQIPIPDGVRLDIVRKGAEYFQNKDGPFEAVQRVGEKLKGQTRQLTQLWFYKNLPSGEKVLRKWMVYSPSKKSLYCYCCRLFANVKDAPDTSKFITGFNKWWKLNPKVSQHENSDQHLANLERWKTLSVRLKQNKTIDSALQELQEGERKKWNDILHRLLDIAMYLAKQNLPFRGHREYQLSDNKGNFLELVELISHYDPVLKEHLVRMQESERKGKVLTTYLSPNTQNELIELLGNTVKDKIIQEITEAKYFGIIFDSTPDISHQDQMSEVIRYVKIEGDNVEIKESFLGFFSLAGKKALDITEDILSSLHRDGLHLNLCRSQGYDNASTMAGVHNGVQARIRNLNSKALFVPCSNHSLNLCGVHSFGVTSTSVTFFGTLESIYNFFSTSTHRWDVLIETLGVSVKRLSETRWSSQHDAVKPIMKHFEKLVLAVEKLCDPSENVDTRGSSEILLSNICNFTFIAYLYLWSKALEEINHAQKCLQIKGVTLDKTVQQLRSLKLFFEENREVMVTDSLDFATKICDNMGIPIEKRGRRRFKKQMPGENARDEGLGLQQELKRNMYECIDKFHNELVTRTTLMDKIHDLFAVVQSPNLIEGSIEELPLHISNLAEVYGDDIEKEELVPEILRLRRHLKAAEVKNEEAKKWSSLDMLQFIIKMDFQESVPNLSEALKIFLTTCVSVASCERSFSKLKLIKSYLRSTMSQTRLNSLAILSIEREVAGKVDFDHTIKQFASAKARKMKF